MDGMIATRPKIFQVSTENIERLWPQLEPLLRRSLRGNDDVIGTDDLRDLLLTEKAQLWVQWGERLEAIIATDIVTYPRGQWLRLFAAATVDGFALDDESFEDVLTQFRDVNDCRGFEVIGRMGWLRRFPEARFVGAVMRVTVQ